MSTPAAASPLDAILAALSAFPHGATTDQIEALLPQTPHSKVQYNLAMLVEQKRVIRLGPSANPLYRLATSDVGRDRQSKPVPGEAGHTGADMSAGMEVAGGHRPRPVAPVPVPPPPAPVVASANTVFAQIVDTCLWQVVASVMPPASATAFLQQQAMAYLPAPQQLRPFLSYALTRLNQLTLAQAAGAGLTDDQYALWRQQWDATVRFHAGAPTPIHEVGRGHMTPPSPTSGATPALPLQPASGEAGYTGRVVAGVPTPRLAAATHTAPDVAPLPAFGANPVAQMQQEIVSQLGLGDLLARAWQTMKQTITRQRAAIAVAWAGAVVLGSRVLMLQLASQVSAAGAARFASGASLASYLIVPLCGLPWLSFRWRDTQRSPSALELAGTLLLGGFVGAILGNMLVGFLSTFTALLPSV